jgi:hypothetical protein
LITIISAYRVSQKSSSSLGVKTAYMQQYRALQSQFLSKQDLQTPAPNKQLILDLQAWIQHLQSQGHHIILNMDNNDDLYGSEGKIHPLPYDPDLPTLDKLHNGSLCTLAMTCELIDVLATQYTARPFPPTYIWGKKRIDYMLILASLQESVERSGILPYCSVFAGDHRPCFLDFNANLLFTGSTSPLPLASQCQLQLSDPRKVLQYKTILYEQLEYHNILEKGVALWEAATKSQWTDKHTKQYETLDLLITQSMLCAEQSCSKRYSKHFEWSPKLIQSVECVHFWRLLLKRSKGLSLQYSTIQNARANAGLPQDLDQTDHPTIIQKLREALQHLKYCQKSHVELRETYLHGLAEAIVLEKRPNLAKKDNSEALYRLTKDQVERLIKR